jgi:hypothetical protein
LDATNWPDGQIGKTCPAHLEKIFPYACRGWARMPGIWGI